MLLLIEHKWNIVLYTRKSILSPESALHPTGFIEDIDIEGSDSFQKAAKLVVGRVTELIEVEMLRNRKLDGGQNDKKMVEIGDIISYNKSEDDKKGVLYLPMSKAKKEVIM